MRDGLPRSVPITRFQSMTFEATAFRRRTRARWLRGAIFGLAGALAIPAIQGRAQEGAGSDPRVGLKAGLRDAGVAIRNMELVASLPKPEGFFDPSAPAGETTPPETAAPAHPAARRRRRIRAGADAASGRRRPPRPQVSSGSRIPISPSATTAPSPATSTASTRMTSRTRRRRNSSRRSSVPGARVMCRCTATCSSCRWRRRAAASIAALRA